MNSNVGRFIDDNRQTGSTTSLAKLAAEQGGYLVVHSLRMRDHVMKMEPRLWPEQVLVFSSIMAGDLPVAGGRQVFVDAACLCDTTGGRHGT